MLKNIHDSHDFFDNHHYNKIVKHGKKKFAVFLGEHNYVFGKT